MRQTIAVLWVILCLTFSVSAWASASDSTLRALEGENILVTTTSGQTHEGALFTFDEDLLVVVDDEGNVHELQRDAVEKVQLPQKTPAAASSKSAEVEHTHAASPPQTGENTPQHVSEPATVMDRDAQANARADYLRHQRELERTGSAYRISGGIITGLGALHAFAAMTSLAITGPHWDMTWHEGKDRDSLRTGAIITAVVGTAVTAAGAALIVVGNKKRRKAQDAHQKTFDLSLSPQFSQRGGGAEMQLRF